MPPAARPPDLRKKSAKNKRNRAAAKTKNQLHNFPTTKSDFEDDGETSISKMRKSEMSISMVRLLLCFTLVLPACVACGHASVSELPSSLDAPSFPVCKTLHPCSRSSHEPQTCPLTVRPTGNPRYPSGALPWSMFVAGASLAILVCEPGTGHAPSPTTLRMHNT